MSKWKMILPSDAFKSRSAVFWPEWLGMIQILLLILVIPVLLSAETKYNITIEQNLRRIAYVRCSTTLSDNTLFMDNSGSHHLKDGYAYYIRNLTVKEISGKEIPWSYKGDGIWELKSQSGRTIFR